MGSVPVLRRKARGETGNETGRIGAESDPLLAEGMQEQAVTKIEEHSERMPAPGEGNFFGEFSVAERLRHRVTDPQKLTGGFPEDENIDEFLKEIYEARR